MKLTHQKVEKGIQNIEVELGQIYKKHSDFYMVTKATDGSGPGKDITCNLTNLGTGSRWSFERTKDQLKYLIRDDGFKLVNVSEMVIKEEV